MLLKSKITVKVKASDDYIPIPTVPAPITVTDYQKPVLWVNDNIALIRKIGY